MLDLPSEREIGHAIGARVRAARLARGVSQVQLGAMLGVTFQQVQKYENASNRISAERLMLISLVLEVPLMDFYGGAPPVAEDSLLSLRDPIAVKIARLTETLPDLYRHRLYKLVETLAKECGQPAEKPSPSGLER